MNCRRARHLLPLAAGGDLPGRKSGWLASHLKKCAGCREELRAYQAALSEMRSLASVEIQPDWPESEWRSVLKLATSQGLEKTRPVAGPFPRRLAWTMSSAIVLILAVGSLLILRNRAEREIQQPPSAAAVAKSKERTFSPKTGPAPLSSPELITPSPRPKAEGRRPLETEKMPAGQALQARSPKKQDVVNMVFVSPESGLTIHWVFNSEFEWKEK